MTRDPPRFVLVLRPQPTVGDPICALRQALKVLLRTFGLRCISIRTAPRQDPRAEPEERA